MKKKLESGSSAQDWINQFAKTGFLAEHMRRYDEMNLVQDIAFRMLVEEHSKPDGVRDSDLILGLMDQAAKINKRLQNLAAGTPILAQMSAMLEHNQQQDMTTTTTTTLSHEEGEQQLDSDLVAVYNLTSNIQDPIQKIELQQALLRAKQEEREAIIRNNQQQQSEEEEEAI